MRTAYSLVLTAVSGCVGSNTEPAPPVTYTVVAGDTLFLIAKRHGVALDSLMALNALNSDLIEVGQVLQIPRGGEALPAQPRRAPGSSKPSRPTTPNDLGLSKPLPQPCLPGPQSEAGADHEADLSFSASQGLQQDEANLALSAFVHHTLKCLPVDSEFAPTATLALDIHVGCDGRVIAVTNSPGDGWTPEVADCIADVLHYVPFPPHSLPDGDWIRYPLTFTR